MIFLILSCERLVYASGEPIAVGITDFCNFLRCVIVPVLFAELLLLRFNAPDRIPEYLYADFKIAL